MARIGTYWRALAVVVAVQTAALSGGADLTGTWALAGAGNRSKMILRRLDARRYALRWEQEGPVAGKWSDLALKGEEYTARFKSDRRIYPPGAGRPNPWRSVDALMVLSLKGGELVGQQSGVTGTGRKFTQPVRFTRVLAK